MDARDIINSIILNTENLKTLSQLLENSTNELNNNTLRSRDRSKILKTISQFNVIMQSMNREYTDITKKCNGLYKVVKDD